MITASHNPAADDGYKIYWENACQIISPHDKGISACIQSNLEPWADYASMSSDVESSIIDITENAVAKYMAYVTATLHRNPVEMNARCPPIMYTAMHGVGYVFVKELIDHFHLPAFLTVPEQLHPDPTFPTVAFPNPEEKGVSEETRGDAIGAEDGFGGGRDAEGALRVRHGPRRGPFHLCRARRRRRWS